MIMENQDIVTEDNDVASKYGGYYGSDDRFAIKMDKDPCCDSITFSCSQCGQSLSVPEVFWHNSLISPERFYDALVERHLPCAGQSLIIDSPYIDAVNQINSYNIDVMKHLKLVQ